MAQFVAADGNLTSVVDTTTTPPWCMVPANGAKTVRLTSDNGLTLKVAPGATANLQLTEKPGPTGRDIQIKAAQPGEARLEAVRGGTVSAALDVTVLPHKEFKISFRFIYDKSGEATGRPLSRLSYQEMSDRLAAMNRIFRPQVNLSVTQLSAGPAKVPDDLSGGFLFRQGGFTPDEIRSLPALLQKTPSKMNPEIVCVSGRIPGPLGCDPADLKAVQNEDLRGRLRGVDLEYNVFSRADENADFTFLLINKLLNAPDVGAFTRGNGCVLPDTVLASARSVVMTHEFGHFLLGRRSDGKAWHTADPQDLMAERLANRPSEMGLLIRKTEALQMARKTPK
jgi:hypothetical protein